MRKENSMCDFKEDYEHDAGVEPTPDDIKEAEESVKGEE